LKVSEGERPKKKSSNRYRNDHVGIINIYRDIFEKSDILESNMIDGQNPYEWLMNRRNQVNYRERKFHDPGATSFLDTIAQYVKSRSLDALISTYIDDPEYLYCFQSDHACLALPLKRAFLTNQDLSNERIYVELDNEKKKLLKRLLTFGTQPISRVSELLS
jgi:hypothetical protein